MESCYICGSLRYVDQHHYDCKEGSISPETVPLCRRCHRTYHDWGIGSFSPDTTTKALEVENYRRKIYNLPLITEADIHHTNYWRKKWGIRGKRKVIPMDQPLLPGFELALP